MTPSIARHCPECKTYARIETLCEGTDLACPQCLKSWGAYVSAAETFERCPMCTCRQFYTVKDFNQALGCLIMGIGIVFVPWTYGLSLPVFAFIDWLIYRRIPTIICCYRCGGEFRGFKTEKPFKPFMHHIGLKYDKYR